MEKLVDVLAIIDVLTSNRYAHVRSRDCVLLCRNLRKRFVFRYIACTGRTWRYNQRVCYILSTYHGHYKCLYKTNTCPICY